MSRTPRVLPRLWLSAIGLGLSTLAAAGCNVRSDLPPVAAAAPAPAANPATVTPPPVAAPVIAGPVEVDVSVPAPPSEPMVRVAEDDRTEAVRVATFPVPVYELNGSAADMGARHGELLGADIRTLHEGYTRAYFGSEARRLLAMAAATAFESRLRPEHRDELRALASQTAIDAKQMMLAQCFLDLSAVTACSTITLPPEAAPDGVARFGRNLDFPGFNLAENQTVVLVYRPEAGDGRYAFAAVGWPGLIGVLTGMNEHGLTLANMEVKRDRRLPSAMPYTLLYRTVLENCKSVDEAIALLEQTPRQTANNLMLMDAAGNRAVAEITPEAVTVRRGEPGSALISTNHPRGPGPDADHPGLCRRYDRLRHASGREFGHIDANAVGDMLARVSQGKYTLQSMVFEPANRVMYLATGRNAPGGTFHRLDLREYFD